MQNNTNYNQNSGIFITWKKLIATLLMVASLSVLLYYFHQYHASQKLLSQAQVDNTALLLDVVGKLTVLPQDELPNIATINDVKELPNQAFFKQAQKGDKLLVFSKSQTAILYRPSLNKIVVVTSINYQSEVSDVSSSSSTLNFYSQ